MVERRGTVITDTSRLRGAERNHPVHQSVQGHKYVLIQSQSRYCTRPNSAIYSHEKANSQPTFHQTLVALPSAAYQGCSSSFRLTVKNFEHPKTYLQQECNYKPSVFLQQSCRLHLVLQQEYVPAHADQCRLSLKASQ